MSGHVKLRAKLEIDTDGQFEIDKGGYSNVKEIQDETKAKTDSGEWECYLILVEELDPDSDTWDTVASLGSSVHDGGFCGYYHSPDEVSNESLRDTVKEVWEQALAEIKERPDSNLLELPKPQLIMNAGELRDIWSHLQQDKPFTMRLSNGQVIEVVAGDPLEPKVGKEFADLDEIIVRSTGL
ncbi:hypothetical protein [Streptomyces atratus]|uniref:hypothetical protein n=1 Tax=Streptomyces atratus TaxID=1893 RepID=UPI003658B973